MAHDTPPRHSQRGLRYSESRAIAQLILLLSIGVVLGTAAAALGAAILFCLGWL